MAEARIICCCGASVWARVIAYLEIITNSILALFLVLALAGYTILSVVDNNQNDPNLQPTNPKVDKELTAAILALMVIGLLFCAVSIFFAILLLRGTNRRLPSYLKAWLIFSVIGLIWTIVSTALSSDPLVYIILKCTVQLLINGFGIWVVYILKKEIEDEIYVRPVN